MTTDVSPAMSLQLKVMPPGVHPSVWRPVQLGRAASLNLTAARLIGVRSAEGDARMIAALTEDERREFARLLNIISEATAVWD